MKTTIKILVVALMLGLFGCQKEPMNQDNPNQDTELTNVLIVNYDTYNYDTIYLDNYNKIYFDSTSICLYEYLDSFPSYVNRIVIPTENIQIGIGLDCQIFFNNFEACPEIYYPSPVDGFHAYGDIYYYEYTPKEHIKFKFNGCITIDYGAQELVYIQLYIDK